MHKIVFATNNQHKADEIRAMLPRNFEIVTLKDAGIDIDIPEPHDTLEENAGEKSATIYRLTGQDCFGEDTGLEVEALNGEPGVKSARYAGEHRDFSRNVQKLLRNLNGNLNRKARFRTVVSLRLGGEEYRFEGICNGVIADTPGGTGGFGYDPVFVPENDNRTFAEMTLQEKNQYSHRSKAVNKLIQFLLTKVN